MIVASRADMRDAGARLKVAELTSAVGAGVLGLGICVLAAVTLRGFGIPFLAAGLALHAWGMADKHRMERGPATPVWWSTLAYWTCWVSLAAIAAYALWRAS